MWFFFFFFFFFFYAYVFMVLWNRGLILWIVSPMYRFSKRKKKSGYQIGLFQLKPNWLTYIARSEFGSVSGQMGWWSYPFLAVLGSGQPISTNLTQTEQEKWNPQSRSGSCILSYGWFGPTVNPIHPRAPSNLLSSDLLFFMKYGDAVSSNQN